MLQVSTVHSTLAAAAESVPLLKSGLEVDFYGCDDHPRPLLRFVTALLLRWARHVQTVNVYDRALGCCGLYEFLTQADSVTDVHIESNSLLEAAQADRLLHACTAVKTLSLCGSFMPSCFPSSVTKLQADFKHGTAGAGATDAVVQCDALLYRAGSLLCLEELSLSLTSQTSFLLTCPIQMALLQVLELRLSISSDINLSWVHLQACPHLQCSLYLNRTKIARHKAAVAQLSPFAIRGLTLRLNVQFTPTMQKLWSQLNVCSLILASSVDHESFSTASQALMFLPVSCTNVIIEVKDLIWHRVIYISAAALVSQAANIHIVTEDCARVEVLGAGAACMTAANEMQQPWQIVVQGAKSVQGLPPSLATSKTYFQQNAAACGAGWTDETK